MQDKTWYSILGLDAKPLFLQEDMLSEQEEKKPKYFAPEILGKNAVDHNNNAAIEDHQ